MDLVMSWFGLNSDCYEHLWLFAFGVMVVFVTLMWAVGLRHGHHSMMDAFYGLTFVAVSWFVFLMTDANSLYAGLLILMVSLHGCRLGYHLTKRWFGYRNTTGGDKRLMAMARGMGKSFWWKSYLKTMLPQAPAVMVIGLPAYAGIMVSSDSTSGLNVLAVVGMAVFGIGSYYEWLADGQLQAFKQDPANKGRYLQHGVWRLTRHPHYLGNTLVWWGIYLTALAADWGLWWTIVGPAFNHFMLTRLVGVRVQNRVMANRSDYQHIMASHSAFLPRPPRDDRT